MSFPRRRESITCRSHWTPAFAGVTNIELVKVSLSAKLATTDQPGAIIF